MPRFSYSIALIISHIYNNSSLKYQGLHNSALSKIKAEQLEQRGQT